MQSTVAGATVEAHLEQVAATLRIPIEQVIARYYPESQEPTAELPAGAEAVWEIFIDLSLGRGHSFGTELPITWEALYAWSRLSGVRLYGWEINALRKLDLRYLKLANGRSSGTGTED